MTKEFQIDVRDIVQRAKDKCYTTLAEAFDDLLYDWAAEDEDLQELLRSESFWEDDDEN